MGGWQSGSLKISDICAFILANTKATPKDEIIKEKYNRKCVEKKLKNGMEVSDMVKLLKIKVHHYRKICTFGKVITTS